MVSENNIDKLVSLLAPVLRGLLSEPTGDDDLPWRSPVLKFDPKEKGTGEGVLVISKPDLSEPLDRAVNQITEVVKNSKPLINAVSINGLGHFTVSRDEPKSSSRIAGHVAVVTGAAGAIGYGICEGLLQAGCRLAVTDLPGPRLEQFAEELRQLGYRDVIGVGMDVTDPLSVSDGFTQIVRQWGGMDLLVLNAGIALAKPLIELELDQFRKLEKVNVEGTLLCLSEAGKLFGRQKTGGDIVLVSTKNVYAPGAGFGAYSATKAGAHQLCRIAGLEFAPLGVRVNMVAPDAVFSGGTHKSGLWAEVGPERMKARGLDEKGLEEYYRNRNLLKARVTAKHVANGVLFFATRQTPTTGACIPIDGGLPDAVPR